MRDLLIIMVFVLAACRKPCTDERTNLRLEPETLTIQADSIANFNMTSSTGFEVTFSRKYAPQIGYGSYHNNGCNVGTTEYLNELFESTYSDQYQLGLSASPEGQTVSVKFNGVYAVYNLTTHQSVPSSSDQGTFIFDFTYRSSENVDGKTYTDVYDVEIKNTEILQNNDPKRIVFAKKFGLLKYYEKGGTVWIRKS
jgi:hypothetical protein